jgi:cytochrome c-type biogenesis protein CcmH/NrfG
MTFQEAMTGVRQNPANPASWVTLGDFFAAEGNWDKARKSYEVALKHDPQCAAALIGMERLRMPGGSKL